MNTIYKVDGMSCIICKNTVEKTLNKIDGVNKASVNLLDNEVLIDYDENKVPYKLLEQEIQKAGNIINNYGEEFLHNIGHGFGIDIHEFPFLNNNVEEELIVNDTHTIEPGIYIPGIGGVRIEDDYLVKKDGYENLTPNITTKLLII